MLDGENIATPSPEEIEADKEAVAALADEIGAAEVAPLDAFDQLDLAAKRQAIEHEEDEHEERKRFAHNTFRLLTVQLTIMNAIFVAYAWAGVHWRLSDGVVIGYLSGTFGEIVAIILIVAGYLFRLPPPKSN